MPQPANFTDQTTGEGSTALGYCNVKTGDMPYFTELAHKYTISDNYHQPVMGGTGANSIMIGTADALYYTDGKGNIAQPPANEIEDPRPQNGTNNWYAPYNIDPEATFGIMLIDRPVLARLWTPTFPASARCA